MSDFDAESLERTVVRRADEVADELSPAWGPAREREVGDIVGAQYKLTSVLGRGGMGVVFCAEHLTIGREYALKTLAVERAGEIHGKRFKSEGRAIARLDHRNIVKVYDMGVDSSGCMYYVMDRLDGISLAEMIDPRNLLPLETILAIFSQICAGLGYAHRQGLVHRDVKPSNIILCKADKARSIRENPLVKIIDYGLVKEVTADSRFAQSETSNGQVCGSPLYMSPEQGMGSRVDERSDIYSLGCTLFECLTGEPPFNGKNAIETAFLHQYRPVPSLQEYRPDKKYPANLEQVVARMLEKSAVRRYQTMEQVAQDLERVKIGASVNREAAYIPSGRRTVTGRLDGTVHDTDDDGTLPVKLRRHWPVAAAIAVGVLISLTALTATVYTLFAPKNAEDKYMISAGYVEDPVMMRAHDVFKSCPQISNGVVELNGVEKRVFNFPSVSLGFISWGPDGSAMVPAQGQILVPPGDPVTLYLPRPEGLATRAFPGVLTKIGPTDIDEVRITEPAQPNGEHLLTSELRPELIEAMKDWKNLRRVSFYHCYIKGKAMASLNDLPAVNELRMRDAEFLAEELARVKWLKNVTVLDIKGCKDCGVVLRALSGSTQLHEITIDSTSPSAADLEYLSQCPKLEFISCEDLELDRAKAAALARTPHLSSLNLKGSIFAAGALAELGKSRSLADLNVIYASLDENELSAFRRAKPNCRLRYERFRQNDLGKGSIF
ncbi:MAG: serine/threonine protein kinase [Cyanobacteria bacterium REEB67]|nr:serine/threonine protein kinase [Cyanobacteria bacterium REEB67]